VVSNTANTAVKWVFADSEKTLQMHSNENISCKLLYICLKSYLLICTLCQAVHIVSPGAVISLALKMLSLWSVRNHRLLLVCK